MTTYITTKLPLLTLTEKLIAVEVAANERLREEALKTAAVKTAEAERAKNVIAEQAKEIVALKGRINQLEAEKVQEQTVNQSLRNLLNDALQKVSELTNQTAYLERGIAAINREHAQDKDRRSEYYDIIGGLLGWPGHSRDAALAKCRRFGFI